MFFIVERYTTSVPFECRSFIIAIKAENNLHHGSRQHHEDKGQRSLVPGTTLWRLSHIISVNMLPDHAAGTGKTHEIALLLGKNLVAFVNNNNRI